MNISKELFESVLHYAIQSRERCEKKHGYTSDSAFLGAMRDALKASESGEIVLIVPMTNPSNPFTALTQNKRGQFEALHMTYMNTSRSSPDRGKVVKEKNKAMGEYLISRRAWALYEKWTNAIQNREQQVAASIERELIALVARNRQLLETQADLIETKSTLHI